jgi:hypothetical protein
MEPKLDLEHMGGYEFSGLHSSDTVTLSSLNHSSTVINGGYLYPNTISATGGPFTINSGGAGSNASPYTYNPWTSTTSGKIKLDGADADVEINGISLLKTMQEIQNRLNLLQPNVALETEWEELYVLGKKYRELEQQIKDKQATWDRLKAMPPPELD